MTSIRKISLTPLAVTATGLVSPPNPQSSCGDYSSQPRYSNNIGSCDINCRPALSQISPAHVPEYRNVLSDFQFLTAQLAEDSFNTVTMEYSGPRSLPPNKLQIGPYEETYRYGGHEEIKGPPSAHSVPYSRINMKEREPVDDTTIAATTASPRPCVFPRIFSLQQDLPIPPAATAQSAVSYPTPRIPCFWVGCMILLDDVSVPGMKRHLAAFHADEAVPEPITPIGVCKWTVDKDGQVCGKTLHRTGLGKHIASVHLKSTVEWCPRCHTQFSRRDCVIRHLKNSCGHA
ncbi:uncharacterized protein FIBRA_08211 [Fibroporia radiculosa]|uniref:Uncharacterized protein n=1 Tax=Fibroporia radiculosa TaxID=599839 RepID=J4GWE1_9APHY|nr:uncharacterized protein FIBRA_08211 [Fibroporia radiculosa]CCM05970.1 predicted protein [Fibroporia radiculosa]